jgi:hypothetical protein
MEALDGVSPAMAVQKPSGAAHSIWEYVTHCTAWITMASAALVGKQHIPSDEENWSTPHDTSDEAWLAVRQRLNDEHKRLLDTLELVDDSILSKSVPGRHYDFYTLLHGIAEHNAYHIGQIMLLKRLIQTTQ